MSKKLWGGRFAKQTHADVEEYTSSLSIDSRLWEADLRGSIAHARMLGAQKILPPGDAAAIIAALEAIRTGIGSGELEISAEAEDIHSAIETLLTDKIGEVAGKLHTARSRNDQVATACRLYLRDQTDLLCGEIAAIQGRLITLAENHLQTILPGLTHMQHAQPISLAHHLMAYFWMFERDAGRLRDTRKRINELPLGSAALAGTSFPLDREAVARELGFEGICENSLDAVSDRDFAVEFLSTSAQLMTHLSRLAEELVLWSSPAYGYVELDDEVTTGSSIMPQKKNPDVAELIRGRVGRVTGALMGLLTTLKALPLSYNRDLQEDKFHLFEGLDTARSSVRLMDLMLSSAKFKAEKMEAAIALDYSNATDLADLLAKKGVPFRQAHEIVGQLVRVAVEKGVMLQSLSLDEMKSASPVLDAEAYDVLDPRAIVEARLARGGTSSRAVQEQINRAKTLLSARSEWPSE